MAKSKARKNPGPQPVVRESLDAVGMETVCSRIEAGETQSEIAKSLKVSVGSLSTWLTAEANSERFARARLSSAEGWLDRGLAALTDAKSTNPEIARARAIAQECARRAALRNPAYRESKGVELSGGVKVVQITGQDADVL